MHGLGSAINCYLLWNEGVGIKELKHATLSLCSLPKALHVLSVSYAAIFLVLELDIVFESIWVQYSDR